MPSFTPPFDPTALRREEPDVTIALPDPPRAPSQPLARPGVARFAGSSLTFLHVLPQAAGGSFNLFPPVTGPVRLVDLSLGDPNPLLAAGISTLLEISPLPFGIAAALRALGPGLPTFYLGYRPAAGAPPPPEDDDLLRPSRNLGPALEAFLGVLFQDRAVLAPWAWIELIGAAMQGVDSPAEVGLWAALASLYPAGRRLRLLDSAGRPFANQPLRLSPAAGPAQTVQTDVAGELALPAGALRLQWQSSPLSGDPDPQPVHALYEQAHAAPTDAANSAPPEGEITLPAGFNRGHLQVLDAGHWFAMLDLALPAELRRFHPGSRLEPLVDGAESFKLMLEDLQACAAGGCGAHFAGWSFNQFPFDPGGNDPDALTLTALTQQILGGGGGARFLMDRFFNLRADAPVDPMRIAAFLLLMAGSNTLLALSVMEKVRTDEIGYIAFFGLTVAAAVVLAELPTGTILQAIEERFDNSHEMADALNAIQSGMAVRSRHPSKLGDNPLDLPNPLPFEISDLIDHVGSWHQKFQVFKRTPDALGNQWIGYLGGIDINKNRLDSHGHQGKAYRPPDAVSDTPSPNAFHDVHARLTGPAVADLAVTFDERYRYELTVPRVQGEPDPLPSTAFPPPNPDDPAQAPPQPARHIVQVGRTGFKPRPGSGSQPLPFSPDGERTIYDSYTRALQAAQEYIYIEDQYFTPDDIYIDRLLRASTRCRRLVIVVPSATDQVFGDIRRRFLFDLLQNGDSTRPGWEDRLLVGAPLRRPLLADAGRVASKGRCILMQDISSVDSLITIGPEARLPSEIPFWLWADGELMFAQERLDKVTVDELPCRRFSVLRASGADPLWGAKAVAHEKGAPVTMAQQKGIYVHSKIMIVDDIFVGIGSANANRRGYFHDGEIAAFAIPEQLKAAPENPALALRTALWAEHLGLSPSMGRALLADPVAAADLFRRPTYTGNRFAPFQALGIKPEIGFPGEASTVVKMLAAFGIQVAAGITPYIWNVLSDPTTGADPDPEPGPAPLTI